MMSDVFKISKFCHCIHPFQLDDDKVWLILVFQMFPNLFRRLKIHFSFKNTIPLSQCFSNLGLRPKSGLTHCWVMVCLRLVAVILLFTARPIGFFWSDTDVFQFSLPISDADIFVLLKQYLFCFVRQNNRSWSNFAFSQIFSNYS